MPHYPSRLVTVGEVDLCFDALGAPESPTMLLIMGISMGFQLIHWPEDLCRQLAAEGFRVVRFDNRDAGRSTHLPGRRYTLEDMANDSVDSSTRSVSTAHAWWGVTRRHVGTTLAAAVGPATPVVGVRGNPVEIRDCPAAVNGNDRRQEALGSGLGSDGH